MERNETQKLLGVTTLDCLLELLDEVIEGRTDEELKRLAGDLKGDLENLPFADRSVAASKRKDMNEMAKEALEDLSSISDEELQRRFESHGNDEKRKEQIEAEANKRMPNNFLYAGAFSDGAEWADANPIKPQGDEEVNKTIANLTRNMALQSKLYKDLQSERDMLLAEVGELRRQPPAPSSPRMTDTDIVQHLSSLRRDLEFKHQIYSEVSIRLPDEFPGIRMIADDKKNELRNEIAFIDASIRAFQAKQGIRI